MDKYCKKYGFPCALWAVLGSHGIVVKCSAAICFSYGGLECTANTLLIDCSMLSVQCVCVFLL